MENNETALVHYTQLYPAKNGTKTIRGDVAKEALFDDLMSDSDGVTVKKNSKFGITGLKNKNNTELVTIN